MTDTRLRIMSFISWLAFLGSVALFLSSEKAAWTDYVLMLITFIGAILATLDPSLYRKPRPYQLKQIDRELIMAASANDLRKVKELLEKGADPNAPRSGDGSALIYACDFGNVEMVKLLLESKANANHQDEANGNALEIAAFIGSPEIVELLIQAGANVNAKSFLGSTALGCAKNNEIAEMLRRAGATS